MKKWQLAGLLVILGLALAQASAQIPSTTWTGAASDGIWANPGNWTDGVVPYSGYTLRDVVFNTATGPTNGGWTGDAGQYQVPDVIPVANSLTFSMLNDYALPNAGIPEAGFDWRLFSANAVSITTPHTVTGLMIQPAGPSLTINVIPDAHLVQNYPWGSIDYTANGGCDVAVSGGGKASFYAGNFLYFRDLALNANSTAVGYVWNWSFNGTPVYGNALAYVNGTLKGSGGTFDVSVDGATALVINGILSPGATAGAAAKLSVVTANLYVDLGYSQLRFGTGAQLVIDVANAGGVAGTSFDQVAVTGNANVSNANLVLNIAAGLDLTGKTLSIMTASLTDFSAQSFANVANVGGIGQFDNGAWKAQVNFGVGSITLSNILSDAPAFAAGDADMNGYVDDNDLNVVLSNWGAGSTWGQGDFDKSGSVDDNDLNAVLSNWTGAPAAAPEPVTLSLLAIGGIAMLRRKAVR